jgi:hypothetical protein
MTFGMHQQLWGKTMMKMVTSRSAAVMIYTIIQLVQSSEVADKPGYCCCALLLWYTDGVRGDSEGQLQLRRELSRRARAFLAL